MPRSQYKVSGTGWLCFLEANGNWAPIFKLTPEQIRAWNKFHEVTK